MNNFKTFSEALFKNNLPVNPIPFATALSQFVAKNGTDSIRSDEAKRILWILMAQAYGELANINLPEEWDIFWQKHQGNLK